PPAKPPQPLHSHPTITKFKHGHTILSAQKMVESTGAQQKRLSHAAHAGFGASAPDALPCVVPYNRGRCSAPSPSPAYLSPRPTPRSAKPSSPAPLPTTSVASASAPPS